MRRVTKPDLTDIFPGESAMAQAMRAHEWAATALGEPGGWPEALKIPLRILLTSRFEMWLGWGPELNFFYNDAYVPTLGIKHPVALGRPFQEVWAEVYDDVADQVARVRAGEATWNKALLLLLERSGFPEETYHSFSYSPLYDAEGAVGGMLCVVNEETGRVIGERRLETVRQLGLSLAGATDLDKVRAGAQAAFASNRHDFPFAAIGLARDDGDELFRQASPALPAEPAAAGAIVALPQGSGWPTGAWDRPPTKAIAIAIPGVGPDTQAGTLLLALNPYIRDAGDLLDTARLLASQIGGALANCAALNSERRRADRMWSLARDLIVVVDADGVFRSVSPSWTRILGQPAEEIVGRAFAEFMHPDDIAASNRALAEALAEQNLSNYANRFRAADGTYHLIEWHTVVEDGLVYAYGRDVTERERVERELGNAREALFQAQKMDAIGQLTGGIAHDFNNLLMAVLGSLDLLRKRLPDEPQAQRLLNNAVEGAQRGATLTQRLLAFARRQDLTVDRVDLTQLLAGMNDLVQRSIGPEWPISTSFPLRLPPVRADANHLEMALLNLIVNARDAMPGGGTILIAASCETIARRGAAGLAPGDYVRLVVNDRGAGMDAETLRRATEPFFTTKGVGKGTGLGLPMVHGTMQQFGGALEMLSSPGKGTSAVLWLPLSPDEAPPAEAPAAPPEPVRSPALRILAVDDDPLVLLNTTALLEDLGHEVIEAESAAAALEMFRARGDIDLLVTDQAMPNMTGAELVAAIDDLRPGAAAIIVSGYAEGVELPGREVVRLAKPFNQLALAEAVLKATGRGG
ncbi:MAG: PAS domain-containing protein [Novosphingobium sp.]|nr:PAS domain-containing protein [Novosphingobium sp.]